MKKIFVKIIYYISLYIKVWKRKGTGMTYFDIRIPRRIILSTKELKKQEKHIIDNKLSELEANEYRRKKTLAYCNNKRKMFYQ